MAKKPLKKQPAAPESSNQMSASKWWGRINACRRPRGERLKVWQDSVSYRRGKPFKSTPPEDTVNVPADWSRTKNKVSQLFMQVPEMILEPRHPRWAPQAPVFAAALNFELSEKIHLEHVMHECLADVVNAAGIMIAMVSFEASYQEEEQGEPAPDSEVVEGEVVPQAGGMTMPSPPPGPDAGMPMMAQGQPPAPPMASPGQPMPPQQPQIPSSLLPVYQCYEVRRLSPAHLVWPLEFVGSNWQRAPFIGHEGYMPLAEAVRLGWVPEGTQGVQIQDSEWLLVNEYADMKPADSYIKYVELFVRPYYYDPAERDPRKIQRLVLIADRDGDRDQFAVNEPFKWQKQTPDGKWIGMTDFPIKVGTLTHVSDMAIPPSDSEIGRPQVRELIKARTQMMRQRDHSLPLRWFDVNQVDPIVATKLRNGKMQDMIPMNGPGDHAIGEVARAQYPNENWNFDKIIKADLDESWSMGAMQQGLTQPGDTTATEVKAISGANDLRLSLEQQWVMRFVVEIAQAVGSLMQMFSDGQEYVPIVGDDGLRALQAWDKNAIQGEYIFKYKPDSQLRLDVSQRRAEGLNLYKLLRKDPRINPELLIRRVLEDHGLDWTKMIVPQSPPQPEKPKVSASFKGDDLMSPMAVALLNKSDTPISQQDIEAAKQLIQSSAPSQVPPEPQGPPMGGPQLPPGPGAQQPHPGPADVVQPLNRRYEVGGDHGAPGSRDSGMPAIPQK